jgi:hypothetical protein
MSLEQFIKTNNDWISILENEPYNIIIKSNDNYYILSYNQESSDFKNNIVRECRGIILCKKTHDIVCRPFNKFGNYGESYAPTINWETANVQEKIDGSLIKVWKHNSKWNISTNNTIDAFKTLLPIKYGDCKTFGEAFMKGIEGKLNFENLNENYTYMFELVGPYNKIIISYKDLDIYHIGTRNIKTGDELNINIGLKKPKLYNFNSLEETIETGYNLSSNEEGYVVVDDNWNRLKIKSVKYIKSSRLNGDKFTLKKAIKIILENEQEEFLTYFPIYNKIFNELTNKVSNIKLQLIDILTEYENHKDKNKKDLSLWAKNTNYPKFIFSFISGKIKSINEWLLLLEDRDIIKIFQISN